MIDALDKCGGLRHDESGKEDFQSLMRTLKRWTQVDHLKKFKVVITSQPEDCIALPDSISIYEIPSGSNVKSGDDAFKDIHAFLKSQLDDMKMKAGWIVKALDHLVPRAARILIWATTAANFLESDPESQFAMLEKGNGKGLKGLYPLYSTVLKASFGHDLEDEEIGAVTSVIGAMIFAKKPLDDDMLITLPQVKIPESDVNRLGLIRKGLASVIDSGPILHFHHRSFEDFLLSPFFREELPRFSGVQDRDHHEHQLATLCLKTMVSSKLHFNMGNLESSTTKNVDIQPTFRSIISPLISYSSLFWVDHLIQTPPDEKMMEAVKFVMYEKLLFWLEVMSLTGNVYKAYLILKKALSWTVCLQVISVIHLILAGQSLNRDHELTLFINDALRFVSVFFIPISQHAPHVYLSALPFAPEQSHVAKKFCPRVFNTVAITQGKPSQWPMVVFTAEHHNAYVQHVVFSLDESIFASITSRTMYVCDSETGHCISGPFELPNYGKVYNACFSPDGKHILLEFGSYAVVWDIEMGEEQFQIEGYQFAFIHHDRRIVSACGVDGDWVGSQANRILVQLWDGDHGTLISDRLLEVNDVVHTQFSPDGHFLAVGRRSEAVIELWNLEDGKDPQQFAYPHGKLLLLCFSPTSDTLMTAFEEKPCHIYFWRLDTQEMVSFSHDFNYTLHVIHSSPTNYLFIQREYTVEMWDVSTTGSKMIWEKPQATSYVTNICPSRDGHRLLVGYLDGSVRMWDVDLEDSTGNRVDTIDSQDDTDT